MVEEEVQNKGSAKEVAMGTLTKEFTYPVINHLIEEVPTGRVTRSCLITSVAPMHSQRQQSLNVDKYFACLSKQW